MAKAAYIGVNNVARKIKGGYIGVDGIARKIKKAYIGVGGVARPAWPEDGPLTVIGSASTTMSQVALGSGEAGNYVVYFHEDGTASAYHKDTLTKTNCTSFFSGSRLIDFTAGGFNSYAIVAGGYDFDEEVDLKTVYKYNSSLTRSTCTSLRDLTESAYFGRNANYAFIAGGYCFDDPDTDGYSLTLVNAYNTSFTRSSPSNLTESKSLKRTGDRGFTVGQYAVFGRLENSDRHNYPTETGNAYNTSATRTNLPLASKYTRRFYAGDQVGSYGIFGYNSRTSEGSNASAYNTSLTFYENILSGISGQGLFLSNSSKTMMLFSNGTSIYNCGTNLTLQLATTLSTAPDYGGMSVLMGNRAFILGATYTAPIIVDFNN